jgi:hypothetical protein
MNYRMSTTYQLFLGRTIPNENGNGYVSNSELESFLTHTVGRFFNSWTLTEGVSCWKGILEDVVVVTIIASNYEHALDIRSVAKIYKDRFNQDAVLINSFRSDSLLIE